MTYQSKHHFVATERTYFIARDEQGNTVHEGFVDAGQEVSSGQPICTFTQDEYEHLYTLRDYADKAEPLPEEGERVDEGQTYKHGDLLLMAIQSHIRMHYDPIETPALFRVILLPKEGELYPPWKQPLGAHDAYPKGFRVVHNGQEWESDIPDNVWEPSVHGWSKLSDEEEIPEWTQPTGAHDAYPAGAIVTHNGKTWENTHGDGNVWEPGVFGWTEI